MCSRITEKALEKLHKDINNKRIINYPSFYPPLFKLYFLSNKIANKFYELSGYSTI